MRRLAAIAVVLLPAALPTPAHAVLGVGDTVFCTNCADEPTSIIHQAQVLAQWAQQIAAMKLQYRSLHHLSEQSLATAAQLLSNAQHLPGSAAAELPGLAYGTNLSGAGQQFYNQNHYYTPQGDDWRALEMKRQETSTANLQGEAQTSLIAIEHRLAGLNALQASIPEQPDVTAVSAINAQIASEQAFFSQRAKPPGQRPGPSSLADAGKPATSCAARPGVDRESHGVLE